MVRYVLVSLGYATRNFTYTENIHTACRPGDSLGLAPDMEQSGAYERCARDKRAGFY
jgi:hypothetical protein